MIGDRITNLAGSSEYFWGSLVTYAYEAKVALLHVSWDTLNTRGAVSRETVLEMARGARVALGTDIAVSVSGIAGPGGGRRKNLLAPPGPDWLRRMESGRGCCNFKGDRLQNKRSAADAALQLLLDYLEGRLAEKEHKIGDDG